MTNEDKLNSIIGKLETFNIKAKSLCVMTLATGEQIIGEVKESDLAEPGKVLIVTDPKRIIRMTSQRGGGIEINIFVGEMDLLDGGSIKVIPQMLYRVCAQSVSTQLSIFGLYGEFLDRKIVNKAQEAGLIVPDKSITSPFKK